MSIILTHSLNVLRFFKIILCEVRSKCVFKTSWKSVPLYRHQNLSQQKHFCQNGRTKLLYISDNGDRNRLLSLHTSWGNFSSFLLLMIAPEQQQWSCVAIVASRISFYLHSWNLRDECTYISYSSHNWRQFSELF